MPRLCFKALRGPRRGSSSVWTACDSSCSLRTASSLSASLNFLSEVLAGKSGRTKAERAATPTVAAPSTMKSQRQPATPWAPSSPEVMEPASSPPKAPERMAAEMYTAKRLLCSRLRYHDESSMRMPGAKPDSSMPMTKRKPTRASYDGVKAMPMVTQPQRHMMHAR